MILVYLPNRRAGAAIFAAEEVEEYIKWGGELFCPGCGSKNLYFSRKSVAGSEWMEIEAKCGACSTRFSVPDNVLRGFWRNKEKIKEFAGVFKASEVPGEECVSVAV